MSPFLSYHARCGSEPWDGPAAIAFSDGVVVGAALDRNGLRPSPVCDRTERGFGGGGQSEAGLVDLDPEHGGGKRTSWDRGEMLVRGYECRAARSTTMKTLMDAFDGRMRRMRG